MSLPVLAIPGYQGPTLAAVAVPLEGCPSPVCDGQLVNALAGRSTRTEGCALVRCTNGHEWEVLVRLLPVGTAAGASRRAS